MVDIVFTTEKGILSFKEPEPLEELVWKRWTEWKVISDFLKFCGQRIIVMPKWCWIWFRRKVGKKLQDTLVGQDSGLQIGIDQHDVEDIRDRQVFGQLEIIDQNVKEAQRALVAPFRRSSTTSEPALWSDLRQLIFGLLEGGDLTKFEIKKENGKSPIFSKVTDVIQDPLEVWEVGPAIADLSEVKQINWTNIDRAPELLDIHASHLTQRRSDLDQVLNQLVEIDEELRKLEEEAS